MRARTNGISNAITDPRRMRRSFPTIDETNCCTSDSKELGARSMPPPQRAISCDDPPGRSEGVPGGAGYGLASMGLVKPVRFRLRPTPETTHRPRQLADGHTRTA